HFGRQLSPLPALMAAADATTRLRVGTVVLDNDFRHPTELAKEAATIDVLSEGRFELGLGAGYMPSDYQETGIRFDPSPVRFERLTEAIQVIKGCFGEGPFSHEGKHYQIEGLNSFPKPVQRPRLPIFIGASRRRMLTLAAQEADIIGVEDHSWAERRMNSPVLHLANYDEQVATIREAAGGRYADLELSIVVGRVVVTDNQLAAADELAGRLELTREQVLTSPCNLLGSIDSMVEQLQARRERFDISYVMVFNWAIELFAPVVARLTGT
ncbi:MAG: TIGR03621 family F420-dependent LLM class oxidoreductase, partial [Chloroflexota bacterium]|nr:TIGR03621 family F420-dependent LLM class oxidoreductase [Chloroflexota bacterium]